MSGERWLVVIKRDADSEPEVVLGTEEATRALYDRWRLNWSDVYLAKVIEGPRV